MDPEGRYKRWNPPHLEFKKIEKKNNVMNKQKQKYITYTSDWF